MANVRAINKEKYDISENRFRELYYFCLQYPEWKKELANNMDTLSGHGIISFSSGNYVSDKTAKLAVRRAELEEHCKLIEKTALETEAEIYDFLLKAVTCENITYNYLKTVMGIPCGKKMYYDRRRRFYWILSRKK